jgi:hypothetical protein
MTRCYRYQPGHDLDQQSEGTVLRGNADMLDFARSLGFRVDDAPEDEAALRIVLPLIQVKPEDAASATMPPWHSPQGRSKN